MYITEEQNLHWTLINDNMRMHNYLYPWQHENV
jgi:hypothetical protein